MLTNKMGADLATYARKLNNIQCNYFGWILKWSFEVMYFISEKNQVSSILSINIIMQIYEDIKVLWINKYI